MQGVLQGQPAVQRRAMAKSITLLESTLPAHRVQADELLTSLLPHSGKSFRLRHQWCAWCGQIYFH
jgi:LAO/AO transport system kinase